MPADLPDPRTVWLPPGARAISRRIDCQDPPQGAVDAPVTTITLAWHYAVLRWNEKPARAGQPCEAHPGCGNAARIAALLHTLEDAEHWAREELIQTARACWRDRRIIREVEVRAVPAKDFRRVGMTSQMAREAREVLGRGGGDEAWWGLVKVSGCDAALLPVPLSGCALFIFDRAQACLRYRGPKVLVTLDDTIVIDSVDA